MLEVAADVAGDGFRLGGRERSRIGQYKKDGRGILQSLTQCFGIPAQEEGAAMDRLGAGGVIVQNDYFGGCFLG